MDMGLSDFKLGVGVVTNEVAQPHIHSRFIAFYCWYVTLWPLPLTL